MLRQFIINHLSTILEGVQCSSTKRVQVDSDSLVSHHSAWLTWEPVLCHDIMSL